MPEAAPSRIPRRDGAAVRRTTPSPEASYRPPSPDRRPSPPSLPPGVPAGPPVSRPAPVFRPFTGRPVSRVRLPVLADTGPPGHAPCSRAATPVGGPETVACGPGRVDARSAAPRRRPVPPPGARRGGVRTVEPRQQRARSPSGHSPRGPLAMFFRVNSDVECLRKSEFAAGAQCSPLSALPARHRPFGRPPRLPGRESGVDTATAAGGERADMAERRRAESRGPLQYDPADRDSNTVASVDQERRRGQWGAG